ncbi:MAG TPA: hypothetical protein VLX92_29465 [Kofleriaceae bacterium]|nr:hypothetical protein [Kofleriaceae bacterium]
MGKWAVLAGGCVALAACSPYGDGGLYTCTTDEQCGAGGKCANGACAFPDTSCDTGYRYGSLSGSLAGTCIGGGEQGDGGGGSDGNGSSCYGELDVCLVQAPSTPLTIGTDTSIDTDSSPMCLPLAGGATTWCVLGGTQVMVSAGLTATGSKPLVIVATDTIAIGDKLDVASHRNGTTETVGAGADPSACDAGTAPTGDGGGAGGSFGAQGGAGGDSAPNSHGKPGAAATNPSLQGGCPGQDGSGGGTKAVGGHGGGAVYLYAATSISITGSIDASGEGGLVGVIPDAGGSGGGAGGMIWLESPTVTVPGIVYANGGGGSSGTGNTTGGSNGDDPTGVGPAAGGMGPTTNGGKGGAGGAAPGNTGTDATNGTAGAGGGGGGGGDGVFRVRPNAAGGGGMFSPLPSS